ncbi:serpin family protein [Bacillus sp. EB600]|uniref:serpin family protein n=1 Tax=Bacillus sp. EB600 TaxID=2806345 RepID=UPI00210E0292|nr:serpin family protein [Bacillus sp. EB600]MCQ6278520.1 serpin family protein [Bacillus sp. EB600]
MRKLIAILIIVCFFLVTGCGTGKLKVSNGIDFAKSDNKKIVSFNNKLGLEMLPIVPANGDGNTFISPTSLFMALSMIYNGADGVTKAEIAKVLQNEGMDAAELNKANASMMSILDRHSKNIQLKIANSIWLNKKFHFQTDFAQNNRDYFQAKIKEMDINDPQSPKMINDWVKKSTNDKIEKMIDAPLDDNLVAILINAIYFKGNWKDEFDKQQTEERTFYLADGTTKAVPIMTLTRKWAYMENENFQAVSLPYGDGKMSMKVFLPKENSNLVEFKQMLTNDNWKKWGSKFRGTEGKVMLPKFQLEYEVLLNEPLKRLGMTTAFDKGANFTKMIKENDPIWISKVKQKTFIDVNERGTEAAGATSIEMKTESATLDQPFHMEVNRPFFIVITDDDTGMILFMGSISNPQKGK